MKKNTINKYLHMKIYSLLLIFLLLSQNIFAVPAITTFTDSIVAGDTWERPNQPGLNFSSLGTSPNTWQTLPGNKTYNAYQFNVDNAGDYTIMIEADGGFDIFGILYKGEFDPTQPLSNGVALNDDGGGTPDGISKGLGGFDVYMPDLALDVDSYILVTTSYSTDVGSFLASIIGNYTVTPVGNVTQGTAKHVDRALPGNQMEIAEVLDSMAGATGDMGTLLTNISALPTDEAKRNAYSQLSAQTKPSMLSISNMGASKFTNTASGRIQGLRLSSKGQSRYYLADASNTDTQQTMTDGHTDYSAYTQEQSLYGAWFKGFGGFGDRETEKEINGYDYNIGGVSFGMDRRITDDFIAGVTMGYADTSINYAASPDHSNIDSIYTGIYGSYEMPDSYIDGILTIGFTDYETDRFVSVGNEHLTGQTDGLLVSGYLEYGRDYYLDDWLIQPLTGFEFAYQNQDSYAEKGGSSALMYDDQSSESYKLSLGIKTAKYLYQENNSSLWLQLRSKWIHEFGDAVAMNTAQFAASPGAEFSIQDAKMGRDTAVLGTGIIFSQNSNTEWFADYNTLINPDSTSHLFSGGLKITW